MTFKVRKAIKVWGVKILLNEISSYKSKHVLMNKIQAVKDITLKRIAELDE